ncbi:MAG: ATP-binding cassette domain-containing protein, partial [Chloroflexota bacterium]
MSEEIIIELRNIKKHYDDVLAVNDISLEVRRGELLVLLGSSGCGKTTTLRLIAGLERPNTGEVILN